MPVISEVKSGVTSPTIAGGGLVKVAVSVVVVVGIVLVALVAWGKVAQANIPVVSNAVAPARVYIS